MSKRALVSKLIQDVRASYWFLPGSLVCLAALLAQGTLYLDQHPDFLPFDLPKGLRDTQVDGARSLMSIISQSVFGVAGVMFSMTIVAVSFASGNFGPRLIGNFMRDRGNQWSLGILVATFVYALLITRAIQSPTGADADLSTALFVPYLSILIALGLTFVSVFTVVYFVHHIPETINVSNITAGLGKRLVRDIKTLIDTQSDRDPSTTPTQPTGDPAMTVTLGQSGYIQTMNKEQLRNLAQDHDLFIDVPLPVGEFVTEDTVVLRIWGPQVPDEAKEELTSCFALGHSPTESQNLMFIVDQLVEMIARAMSPGVNDPFTAINCLNWLHSACVAAANHKGGLRSVQDGPVKTKALEFGDLLEASFGVPWKYIHADPLCARHMRVIFAQLPHQLEEPEHLDSFRAFMDRVDPAI
ncbi:DUF2254 domain-containing protein [Sulfitobacter mediterraneus]|uniref:DUF2254 domain-containing protein n=1 Tax=Sulfitobacter mediterraneus TaxID=83219 RepID=A0A061SWD5_9RHOB|nr:DUF2254 domain-containing protein [Sulfitobacter mediterraneus]KAJ04283.1 hypothetical protein PM02_05255 [Sulfitobacter mediterraneus]